VEEITLPPRWEARPPPDLEGERSRPPFEITVNELASFQRCRRAWDFTSANRRSLMKQGPPTAALHIGSAFHYATAMHSEHGADPEQAVREFFALSLERVEKQYLASVGTLMSNEERAPIEEMRLVALSLIRTYYERHGYENPIKPFQHVASELTFRIPLVKEHDVWLIGTIDEVALDTDGNPVPIEKKTYSRRPDKKKWRFNHQLYGYACALSILTGHPVNYACYDGIRKKEPTIPKILKNGHVSRKWIDTTYEQYREVVLATHDGEVPNEYLDILNRLNARDHSPENAFTTRFKVPISSRAMLKWWDDAKAVAMEAAHYPRIYPNFNWQGCPECRHVDLCHAVQAGDKNAIKVIANTDYRRGVTPTVAAVRSGRPIAQRRVKDPRQLAKYSQVTLGYDPDFQQMQEATDAT
jgi:PD-(D/E)XK nuclease superfamily protein